MTDWNIPLGREFTAEEISRITSYYPHCPECGSEAILMHFYIHEIRKMFLEIDGSSGPNLTEKTRCLIQVQDEAHDHWVEQPLNDDYPKLECENGHEWTDTTIVGPNRDKNYWHVREDVRLA